MPTPLIPNRLLAALPTEALARLLPQLELVELPLREVVQPMGRPLPAVYFLESGWVSMLAYLDDGNAAEVGLIGREGMVGLPLLFGADQDDIEGIVQASGTALRMNSAAFQEELEQNPAFRSLLLRYALVYHGQVARTAACNGRHDISQRLARWLLMAHDRVDEDQLPMTQEFLSMMLGVRRAGVTVAAGAFQKAQFIRYERGCIEITDRPGLESTACECYGITRRAFDAFFGETSIYRR